MSRASRQAAAFSEYLDLGPARSLARLHESLRRDRAASGLSKAPSLRTLEEWSARYRWTDRIAEIERQARENEDREHVERVRQHRERLRQEGLLLQQRGIAWLREKAPNAVSAGEAVRAIEAGFKLEALALGEVTERVALEEHDERLERLSDEELELLIKQARAHETGGTNGADETQSG